MQPIKIADGETVTQPGAYQIGIEHYHTQTVCPGFSISSGGLRTIIGKSPHAFWKAHPSNSNRYPDKEESPALALGKAAHALILGDEVFEDRYIVSPDDAPPRLTQPQRDAFKRDGEWSASALPRAQFWEPFDLKAKGKTVVTDEQVKIIGYMAENLAADSLAMAALVGKLTEVSLIWKDEKTGLYIKSRPDTVPDNGPDGGDLKTFAPKGADILASADRAADDNGYYQQMALVKQGMKEIFGIDTTAGYVLVFIQSTPPYEVVPIEIDVDTMYWAGVLNRAAIDAAAECLASGVWPQRSQWIFGASGMRKSSYPQYKLHRFAEMQGDGRLPNN